MPKSRAFLRNLILHLLVLCFQAACRGIKVHHMALIPLPAPSSDPCDRYTIINNPKRSTKYKLDKAKEDSRCDIFLSHRWYRFKSIAGEKIPTSPPDPLSCGTEGPIWAKGKMPEKVTNITTMKACVLNKADKTKCLDQWNIRVKKCSKNEKPFFVYLLKSTTNCPMSYCAGECSPSGNDTKCKPYPYIYGNVTVKPGIKDKRVTLECKFTSLIKDSSGCFQVEWLDNNSKVIKAAEEGTLEANHSALLTNDGTLPYFKLGTSIYCRVRSWFNNSKDEKSPFEESNHYFAGIKITPQVSSIKEGQENPLIIKLKSTVPIVCAKENCKLYVKISFKVKRIATNICGAVLTEKIGETNVSVVASSDWVKNEDNEILVGIKLVRTGTNTDWASHVEIPKLKILVKDVETGTCTSTGDPHIKTFDGLYYHHYQAGTYVLVKSSRRKFQVHVRTKACGEHQSVTCNCGVAAREGKDVMFFDYCQGKIKYGYLSEEPRSAGTSFTIFKTTKDKFMMKFPSSATIVIKYFNHGKYWRFIDITVSAPSVYYGHTIGLCGIFDSNINNDWTAKSGVSYSFSKQYQIAPYGFSEYWKISDDASLFNHAVEEEQEKKEKFCFCSKNIECQTTPPSDRKHLGDYMSIENESSRRRRRRSSSSLISDDLHPMKYDPAPINVSIPTWPTKSGKTLSKVKVFCNKAVKESAPGLVCRSIHDFDFQPFISQCIEDVKISDDYSFASSAVLLMQDLCEEKFFKNISYWEADPSKNGSLGPPLAIARTFCPKLCSGNGRCVNATCNCYSNYTSADCSIDKNKGPTLESIPLNGLCDVRKRSDCQKIKVNGYDFLDSKDLSCRSTHLKISDKPFERLSKADISSGRKLNFGETLCQLKENQVKVAGDPKISESTPHAGYLIDVSNDGKVYSKSSSMYIIYDSKCMNCTTDAGVCILKTNSCIISGYCFNEGEINPTDACLVCNTSLNTKAFSIASSCIANYTLSSTWTSSYQDSSYFAPVATDWANTSVVGSTSVPPSSIVSISPGCQGISCPESDNKGNNGIAAKKRNVAVIASLSALGGIVVLVIIAIVIIKSKKSPVKKRVGPAEKSHTFVNASFEGGPN